MHVFWPSFTSLHVLWVLFALGRDSLYRSSSDAIPWELEHNSTQCNKKFTCWSKFFSHFFTLCLLYPLHLYCMVLWGNVHWNCCENCNFTQINVTSTNTEYVQWRIQCLCKSPGPLWISFCSFISFHWIEGHSRASSRMNAMRSETSSKSMLHQQGYHRFCSCWTILDTLCLVDPV